MKRLIIVSLACASIAASADVLNKKQRQFLNNRRICVSRDTTTIDGKVISTYYRNGKPDWIMPAVTTNELKKLTGIEQMNPIQVVNDQLRQANELLQREVQKWMEQSQSFSNMVVITEGRLAAASAKIEAEIASLQEEKADLEEKIADSKYILLRPWLKTKLAICEERIRVLQALTATQE